MSIKKKIYFFTSILLLLPIFLAIVFFRTIYNINTIPKINIYLFSFTIIVFILINFFVALYLVYSILEPLNVLAKATKEIKNGNLDFVAHYDSKDEFQELINEFNQMSIALKKSVEQIQSYNIEKRELSASIVHDLKTPISTILGCSQGLLDNIANTEEKRINYIKIIYEKTKHIDNLVDNLFLISKLENNILDFQYKNISIFEINNYIEELCIDLSMENIETDVLITCEKNLVVSIDTYQTKRVLLNIIENSIKYKKENVGLKISFNLWEINNRIILKISDNGIGIKKEYEKKIFERFYRTDIARTFDGGSGLGLTTAKQIIEAQNGEIWARSNENGLSIYISFKKED